MTTEAPLVPLPELAAELWPDEVLLWQARPCAVGVLPGALAGTLFGVAWLGFSLVVAGALRAGAPPAS